MAKPPPPHLSEEVSALPGVSPGVVTDDEILLHEMYEPHQIVGSAVQEQAIPARMLLHDGLSVHRLKYVPRDFLENSINVRLNNKNHEWRFDSVAILEARAVRSLKLENEQALVIIDTASKDNPTHASIFAAPHENRGPSRARKLRSLLLPLLTNRASLEHLTFGS